MIYTGQYSPWPLPPSPAFPAGLTVHRPILQTELVLPGTQTLFPCLSWPDSGADYCAFPASFAATLGLDLNALPANTTVGVGNPANITYFTDLEVRLVGTPLTFTTKAGFTPGLEHMGCGLLGQRGFFENYHVRFDHKSRLFHIEVP